MTLKVSNADDLYECNKSFEDSNLIRNSTIWLQLSLRFSPQSPKPPLHFTPFPLPVPKTPHSAPSLLATPTPHAVSLTHTATTATRNDRPLSHQSTISHRSAASFYHELTGRLCTTAPLRKFVYTVPFPRRSSLNRETDPCPSVISSARATRRHLEAQGRPHRGNQTTKFFMFSFVAVFGPPHPMSGHGELGIGRRSAADLGHPWGGAGLYRGRPPSGMPQLGAHPAAQAPGAGRRGGGGEIYDRINKWLYLFWALIASARHKQCVQFLPPWPILFG